MSNHESSTSTLERSRVRERLHLPPLPGVKGLFAKLEVTPEVEEVATFSKLEELAVTIRHADTLESDDTQEIVHELDDTAELLLKDIAEAEAQKRRTYASLTEIWTAAKAWDTTRSAPTEALVVHLLEKDRALAGREALEKAFEYARESGKPFNDELDRFNEERYAAMLKEGNRAA